MPAIRRVVRERTRAVDLGHDEVIALTSELWSVPIHERRVAAAELLEARVADLAADDLPLLERLIRESRTWALVDPLAASVAGVVVRNHPAAATVLDRWSADDDFWVRRAAVLALLPGVRADQPDLVRLARYADAMLDEKEFFIRKALGWVLREVGQREPAWVVAFLEPRLDRVSGVTIREAVKRLPEADRDTLLARRAR